MKECQIVRPELAGTQINIQAYLAHSGSCNQTKKARTQVLQIDAGLRFCCRPLHCGPETVYLADMPLASQLHPYGNMVSWYNDRFAATVHTLTKYSSAYAPVSHACVTMRRMSERYNVTKGMYQRACTGARGYFNDKLIINLYPPLVINCIVCYMHQADKDTANTRCR